MVIHNPILTGSFTVNNIDVSSITSSAANITALNATTASLNSFSASVLSYTASQNILNGTYTLTSSFAAQTASLNSFSASVLTFTGSASTRLGALEAATASLYTATSSFSGRVGALETYTSSLNNKTSSFATTGSNTFIGTQTITGSVLQSGSFTSTGTLTAQTLVVQTITSSVDFVTGSTRFGSLLDNTHVFSGSVTMNPGGLFVSGSGLVGIGTTNPSAKLHVQGTSYFFDQSIFGDKLGIGLSNPTSTLHVSGTTGGVFEVDGAGVINALFVSASGRIGIGNTTPTETLFLQDPNRNPTIGITHAGGGSYFMKFQQFSGWNQLMTFTSAASYMGINTSGPLILNESGSNVGVGITNPGVKFYVSSSDADYATIIKNTNASGYGLQVLTAGSSTNLAFQVRTNNTSTNAFQVLDNGNVGIGTTSPATKLDVRGVARIGGGSEAVVIGNYLDSFTGFYSTITSNNHGDLTFGSNLTINTNHQLVTTNNHPSMRGAAIVLGGNGYDLGDNTIAFFAESAGSTTAGTIVSASFADMVVKAGGNVGIGTSSPAFKLQVGNQNVSASLVVGSYAGANPEYVIMGSENNGYGSSFFYRDMSTRAFPLVKMWINNASDGQTALDIQNAGGAGVSIVSKGQPLYIVKNSSSQGQVLFSTNHDSAGYVHTMYITADGPPNGAATGYSLGKNSGTNRSINAGGTINASGTDYAEYMTKAIEDNIAKGDIVGVDENGLLTNIFTNSKSFVVKSTDPSYIGGDTWFNEVRPLEDATQEEKDEFEARYQIARAKVDRIAFSGQVPCNVTGANVGDYIIPIELENGKIGGQAITNPTFDQFKSAVGKVWKIMDDGRAWIAVKIG